MEPTDEMVEAARKELRNQGCLTGPICSFPPCACVDRALRAALAVMPFTVTTAIAYDCGYRAGWIAGRDAAAKRAREFGCSRPRCTDCVGGAVSEAIFNMEPPA